MDEEAKRAELCAHLPEHPMEPFLRIVGVALARPRTAGSPCPWGLAEMAMRRTVPRGYLVQHPYHPVGHGEIYVYRCGR